jgi:hypothetical protein
MTLYLLDAVQHQAAYKMIGLAIRIAHALNLHQGLPESYSDIQLARRGCWTVVHLDYRCARMLGCPIGVEVADTPCTLPAPTEFAYHTLAISLTGVTLAVIQALSRHPLPSHENRTQQVESRASALTSEVYRPQDWRLNSSLSADKNAMTAPVRPATSGTAR